MFLSIVFLPFLGSLSVGLFGRFVGLSGSSFITVFCVGSSCFFSFLALYEVAFSNANCFVQIFPWVNSELLFIPWGFFFDTLTVVMLIVVTFISSLVHLYSTEYMCHDPHLSRFMSYLSLFTAFMLILVTADNLIQMFLGWEGIGVSSYLLINFWFMRLQANKASIKAMFVNRIGDLGLALGILLSNCFFQSVEYASIFSVCPFFVETHAVLGLAEFSLLNLIGMFLFIGAVGKSAQIGLHCWLPDAMEGPTPVSALIHAATLVTAGLFLLVRFSPLLEHTSYVLVVVTFFGACTAFLASTTGLFQNDLKRVIAYSTCSQLGYMVIACGISNYSVAVFHLANHAFFKALLFLSAGSVIHGVSGEQDMRKFGGLRKLVPLTYAMIMIGSFSLMGLPFLTGFYSKDVILETAYASYCISGHFAYWLGSFSAFLTAFYSIRLVHLTFLSDPNGYRPILIKAHDSGTRIALPLLILSVPSLFVGYFAKDMFIGLGSDFWSNSIFVHPKHLNCLQGEFCPIFFKVLPVIFSLFGLFSAFGFYSFGKLSLYRFKISIGGKFLYLFFNRKWFFDKVYAEFFSQNFLYFAYHISYKIFDRGFIEIFGSLGFSNFIANKIKLLSNIQTGFFYQYAFFIFTHVGIFVIFSKSLLFLGCFVDFKLLCLLYAGSFLV